VSEIPRGESGGGGGGQVFCSAEKYTQNTDAAPRIRILQIENGPDLGT
jgi:hypothetical protein